MKHLPNKAFTLIELLVVISIIALLAGLSLPAITGAIVKGQMMQTLNNARQLQLATQSVALDQVTSGDSAMIGWPGSNAFSVWVTNTASNANLSSNDLKKLFSAPGVALTTYPTTYAQGSTALRVYAVTETSSADTVFISTWNWNAQSPAALSAASLPYGDKGFLVMRKGGDGATFKANQATNTNLIGTLTNNLN